MKTRYRLICRGSRGGNFYCVDTVTGKRASLHTASADEARQLVEAKNNSHRQLDGIKAKAAVVMIGTNDSNGNDNSEEDILQGVTAIVNQIRQRQPDTKIILLGIFPRGQTFSAQRGKILQVNEALARLDDGKNIFYLDIGSRFLEDDGSISKAIMPDYLHPNETGYGIWADAMEPELKELLGEK